MIVTPVVLSRCVWVECSDCRTTSPMMEYMADTENMSELAGRLREARQKAAAFWNERA